MNDPRARERYDAEVTRTKEISDKVVRDAREARDESVIDDAALQRIVDMSIEYLTITVELLRRVYGVSDQ